jgi:hypothetical protein
MEFRLEFNPKPLAAQIDLKDRIFLIGSCFTEQMGTKLDNHLFNTIQNPSGILFNPLSICHSLETYVNGKKYSENELFYHSELWGSWDHHTRFSAPTTEDCLNKINSSIQQAHAFLKQTSWMMITLGSAFVYKKEGRYVANCHKVPADKFEKVLLSADEITERLGDCIKQIKNHHPDIRFLFTISPVRHLRDGFVENNRSKANLITAVHALIQKWENAFYFPAYELIMDDLRDYRFFAEDMVHPNYAATQYVWEKFKNTALTDATRNILKEIEILNNAFHHKPFHPDSDQHSKFKTQHLEKTLKLQKMMPYLPLSDYIQQFSP